MYRKQLLTILISAAISGAAMTSFSVNAQAAELTADQTVAVQNEDTAAPVSEDVVQEEETAEPEEVPAEQPGDAGPVKQVEDTGSVEQGTVAEEVSAEETPEEVSVDEEEETAESQETAEQEESAVTKTSAVSDSGDTQGAGSNDTFSSGTSSTAAVQTAQDGVAGNHLESQDKVLYEASRTQLKEVADAKDDDEDGRIAAIVTVPASGLLKETLGDRLVEDAQNKRWYVNAADVGITEEIKEYTDESEGTPRKATTADSVVESLFTYNTDTIRDALLADLPYDLYWYDKTSKIDRTVHPYYNVTRLTNGAQRINFYDDRSTISLKFPVTSDYRAAETGAENDPYTVDAEKAATAVSAKNNADQVIKDTENKNLSDLDTLKTYGQTICDLTAYDYDASQTQPYGNSWQMISVFDNDTSTNVTCEGYAKAMQYLCDNTAFKDSSVRCISVTGYLVHDSRIEDHMWNIVRWTDGNNYLVDVTNSDSGTAGSSGQFFMVPVSYTTVADLPSDIAELIKGKSGTITDSTGLYYAPAGTVAGSDGILYYVYDDRTLRTFAQSELLVYGSSAPVKSDVQEKAEEQPVVTEVSTEKESGETSGQNTAKSAKRTGKQSGTTETVQTQTVQKTSKKVTAAVSSSVSGAVNTGDQEQPFIYAVMGAVAAAVLALLRKKRR